ncbi:hypothetical protein [Nocardiopsis suaedae]|uniref:PE-PGRS family protein n=1 Tax=Nocardiopsis suaedae TaxID=3018444 RepID=A0ABT4TNY9_9ACTN|nr:hypothetical protein [Nocardiopsis suaedae]MDA2806356.1 hypothetical protein [Nocardiopsis suaedae]
MGRPDQPRDPATGRYTFGRARPDEGPGLFRRLMDRLFGGGEPDDRPGWFPDEPEEPETVHLEISDDLEQFATPARDDAFTFDVRIRVAWSASVTCADPGERREIERAVEAFVDERKASVRGELMSRVRPLGRRLAPYQAADLERLINEDNAREHFLIPRRPEPPRHGPAARPGRDRALLDAPYELVDAQVHAWVDPCDAVRRLVQDQWVEQTRRAGRQALAVQEVARLAERQEYWHDLFLRTLQRMGRVDGAQADWVAVDALRMATDADASPGGAEAVLRDALDRRTREGSQLAQQLAGMIDAARRDEAGLLEFAFASDTALRAVLEHLGVPVEQIERAREKGDLEG